MFKKSENIKSKFWSFNLLLLLFIHADIASGFQSIYFTFTNSHFSSLYCARNIEQIFNGEI